MPPKNAMRPPPINRPSSARANTTSHLSASTNTRSRLGAVSPAESISSVASRQRSPPAKTIGIKRKERDFDEDVGEETNINVVVRCRGRNDREVRENSGVVLSTDGTKGKTIVLSMGPSALSNKTYHFDKVFSPAADQSMIYDEVVTPILDEMLSGFNCTIFAYGQTGTGKTYTMSGDMTDTLGLLADSAGIIPRVLHSLFRKLDIDDAESSVKCSFIELYNEELRDLLSAEENGRLKIYEDGGRKGNGATLVQGMEETHIKTASEGIKLLQEGSHKRQVAATKCNDLSSRSHTVFTVTAYIKRTSDTGEDLVSAGKLNLVDLAGSENIQRSGAENKRAAEAGLINKSLLTLGRVINALVDKSSHIPYRESKLTRLLQDSLGGRTKTCIIATVSPAKSNLEETISTLDYAFRAKNIRNKPQVNATVAKKTLLREFTAEIEKLKTELIATRQRNGVYLTTEAYEDMNIERESRRILSEEQKAKIETMESNLRKKVQDLFALTTNFNSLKKESDNTKFILDETKGILEQTEFVLANTKESLESEALLRKAHERTEVELNNVGVELISTLGRTVSDIDALHSKIRRKSEVQSSNRGSWLSLQRDVGETTLLVETRITEHQNLEEQMMSSLSKRMNAFIQAEFSELQTTRSFLDMKLLAFEESAKEVSAQTNKSRDDMKVVLEDIETLREDVKNKVGDGLSELSNAAARISAEVMIELGQFHSQLHSSYSTLGREFKGIFESLIKHIHCQREESIGLQRSLDAATSILSERTSSNAANLESILAGERKQAELDRRDLIQQISSLINSNAQSQEIRVSSSLNAVQKGIVSNQSIFENEKAKYNGGVEAWMQKENDLMEEMIKSRDILKNKLKQDWMDANERHTSIQTTTKAVHEETVRVVAIQMEQISTQMKALDDFVTRATRQNDIHHDSHIQSLQGLTGTVRESLSNINTHVETTQKRVGSLSEDVTSISKDIRDALPQVHNQMQQPLVDLRTRIATATIQEDIRTGETPQKTNYHFPRKMPRTAPHKTLLAQMQRSDLNKDSPLLFASPTKSIVFNDADDEVAVVQLADSTNKTQSILGLREVDINVNASTATRPSFSASTTSIAAPHFDMPPPLKRQNTLEGGKPTRFGHKPSFVKLEGRENSMMPVFSSSTGRRLRSTPPN